MAKKKPESGSVFKSASSGSKARLKKQLKFGAGPRPLTGSKMSLTLSDLAQASMRRLNRKEAEEELLMSSIRESVEDAERLLVRTSELDARAIHRLGTHQELQNTHLDFNPPRHWGAQYSILQITFGPMAKNATYVFHEDDEVVVPIRGTIALEIYCLDGLKKATCAATSPRGICAFRSTWPHQMYGLTYPTVGWNIFGHSKTPPAAIGVSGKSERERSRAIPLADCKKAGILALAGFSIGSRLQRRREDACLSLKYVAAECGINASHLSRIEECRANPSLTLLADLARILAINNKDLLRFDPAEGKNPFLDGWQAAGRRAPSVDVVVEVLRGGEEPTAFPVLEGAPQSFVVLNGDILFTATDSLSGRREVAEGSEGQVIHARAGGMVRAMPMPDSRGPYEFLRVAATAMGPSATVSHAYLLDDRNSRPISS